MPSRSLGQRSADTVCGWFGSWPFIFAQALVFAVWMGYNHCAPHPFDPAPWLLLNLLLSFSAAFANPLLQLSQNRLGQNDRALAHLDYLQNRQALERIEMVEAKVDALCGLLKARVSQEESPHVKP